MSTISKSRFQTYIVSATSRAAVPARSEGTTALALEVTTPAAEREVVAAVSAVMEAAVGTAIA